MQWFVKAHVEKETLALSMLDKIKIAGNGNANGSTLFSLDTDLCKTSDEARFVQEEAAENP